MRSRFVTVVPVKPPTVGKSRLEVGDPERRRALASAFALDTVAACLRAEEVGQVLVATDDAAFARDLHALGCHVVPDGDTNDLNAALRQAAAEAHRRWSHLVPVAVCADLPALLPHDLDAALSQVDATGPAFVADAEGSGTTVYLAPYARFEPRFGPGSAQAHRAGGALEVSGELASLRHDVDDLAGLDLARTLGLGPATQLAIAGMGGLSG
ncbi:2-phospho-L-lactate guanylyltransferase [Nocardioides nanhaiensis]|uniref:2-phospho-L-lactate guanylyltransferase n=1 Tax=Nocardioides nanhaiensis TaxID=1476871 RepID=A0ABP8W308_9ACTN